MAEESCSPRSASEALVEGGGWAQYSEHTAAQGFSEHLFSTGKAYFFQSVIMQTTRAEAHVPIAHQPALPAGAAH